MRKSRSVGFTFAWYRLTLELPEQVNGIAIAGTRIFFETNIDNYGEIWVDGKQDPVTGTVFPLMAPYTMPSSRSQLGGGLPVYITNIRRESEGRISFHIGYEYQ